MKNIRLLIPLAVIALFAACQNDNESGPAKVQSIVFANAVNDTIVLTPGQSVKLDVVTTPANSAFNFHVTGAPNVGTKVFDFDLETRTLTGNCGGSGQIIAIAPNGDTFTEAICTVIVNESVLAVGNPNKNLYYLWTRSTSDTRSVNLLELAGVQPPTANLKSRSITHTNATNFNLNASTGVLSYRTANSTLNQTTSFQDDVTIEVVNGDGSKVSGHMHFRNTAYLNITHCCSSYTTYGYYPGGLFDCTTTGGWHSGTATHAPDAAGVHYILVDFKEDMEMRGLEIWRNTTDTRTIELYYEPSTTTVTTGTFNTWKTQVTQLWGTVTFGDESTVMKKTLAGPTITARYLVLKFTQSNRSPNHNITEIYPYIII